MCPGMDDLTPRQRQIAKLVARGMTNSEIANELYITVPTVKNALTEIYRALGIETRRISPNRIALAVEVLRTDQGGF